MGGAVQRDDDRRTIFFRLWLVHLHDGQVLDGRVDEPKGDPGNTLSRAEITDKALRLAAFSGGANPTEMQQAIDLLWNIRQQKSVGKLLSVPA